MLGLRIAIEPRLTKRLARRQALSFWAMMVGPGLVMTALALSVAGGNWERLGIWLAAVGIATMVVGTVLMLIVDRGVRRLYRIPARAKPPLKLSDMASTSGFDRWLAQHSRTPGDGALKA